jgi:ribose 1,5-bisphosphokinase PhnN
VTSTDAAPSGSGRPVVLLLAALVTLLEGLALVALAVAELADTTAGRVGLALSTAAFFAALGGGLVACAWGLAHLRSWARGPVVAIQLLLGLTALSLREAAALSAGLGLAAVVVLVCVLSPPAVRALSTST